MLYYEYRPPHTIYKDHPIIPRRLKNECKYKDRCPSQKRAAVYRNLRCAGSAVRHITVNVIAARKSCGYLRGTGFPDSTAETVMPDNVADLGRIPQSTQTEDVSTGAVADTDAVLDNASGPVGTDNTYIPGIYTTELILGSETVNVEVIVNDHAITSLSLADPDETLTTMYPLLEPTMDSLSEQICETQDLSQVTYSAETRYTSLVLLEAVKASLEKAKPSATPEAVSTPTASRRIQRPLRRKRMGKQRSRQRCRRRISILRRKHLETLAHYIHCTQK